MKWLDGRIVNCKYKKLLIFSFKIWKWGFDAYLLKYEEFGYLPEHKDPLKNGKHYRMNVNLYGNSDFYIKYKRIQKNVIFFRPDIQPHSLWILTPTLKLSLGYAKYN